MTFFCVQPPQIKRTHLFAGGHAVLIEMDQTCANVKRVVHVARKILQLKSAIVNGRDRSALPIFPFHGMDCCRFALVTDLGIGVLDHKLRPLWERSSEERAREIAIGSFYFLVWILLTFFSRTGATELLPSSLISKKLLCLTRG